MVRVALVLAVSLSLAGAASAESWAEALFNEHGHDFGPVPRGTTQNYSFQVTNKTGAPVHISSVRATCICLSGSAAKADLAAGESTTVVVRVDTRRLTGPYQKPVYVQFDQPQFAEVRLNIKANVRDDLTVAPESLDFGGVKQGKPAEAAVTVLITGLADCKIKGVKCDSSYVQPEVKRLPDEAGGVAYRVSARLRPGLPAGHWFAALVLTTDHADVRQFRIPVTVEVKKP